MYLKSQTRTFALAAIATAFFAMPAKADNFLFSITDSSTDETAITGEIFGLTNNSTGAATSIIILTQPLPDLTIYHNLTPTSWQNVFANTFTETAGVITAATFDASDLFQFNDEPPGSGDKAYFDLSTLSGTLLEVNALHGVSSAGGPVTFTNAPEPSSAVLLSIMLLTVALLAKKRILQRL